MGQILSWVGLSVKSLEGLNKEALKDAFTQNCESMAENMYNLELSELRDKN